MPYIKNEQRPKFYSHAYEIAKNAECAGDLNYAITVIVQEYIAKMGLKYDVLNSIHGMLDCCNKELYRRITGPYEDTAIAKNSDVDILNEALRLASLATKNIGVKDITKNTAY